MMKGLFHTTNILLAGLLAGYYMVNFAASTLQDGKPSESCREAETSFGVPKFLAGQWNNELGSRMTILPTSPVKGQFRGFYETAVGDASGRYNLVGMYHYDTSTKGTTDNDCTLGWVVQYQNTIIDSKSVCTWSGQYQEIDGEPKIITTWLLTSQTEPKDNWSSVQVNKDIFSRDYRDANAD